MITSRVVVKRDQFRGLVELISAFPELVTDTAEETLARTRASLLAELRKEPPQRSYPGDYPLEWTSERQRRAYFASDGFGAGIPYRRTGGLSRSWRVYSVVREDRIQIRYENTWSDAPYVVGRIAGDERGTKRKQQFHTNTGWPDAKDTVDAWTEGYIQEFGRAFSRFF